MRQKGTTLMELTIAMILLAAVTATASISFLTMKSLKVNLLGRDATFIEGNLAVATVFERVLRSGAVGQTPFDVQDSGRRVVIRRNGLSEKIWFDPSTREVKYQAGNGPEMVELRNVQNLLFSTDCRMRLAMELTLADGQTMRTSVRPRNHRIPQNYYN